MLNCFPFEVATNSLAAKIGLKPNDFLNSIAGKEVFQMTHEEVTSYQVSGLGPAKRALIFSGGEGHHGCWEPF